MPIDFTVTAQRLINELLPTAGGSKDNFFADSSIGAPMRCEWDVEVSGLLEDGVTLVSLRGTKALINPALFLGSGPGPYPFSADTGYVVDVPVTASPADEFVMSIWTGSPYEESNRNLACILRYVDSNHATIILSFRMTMDMGGHIDGSEQQNHKRLTYSHKSSPNDGQAHGIGSVYRNTNRKLSGKITLTDLDGFAVTKDAETGAMSRWFLAGLPNDTDSPPDGELIGGEFNWWFDLLRGGVVVEDLSVYQETEVNLYLDYDGSYTIDDNFMVYVVDKTPGTNLDRYAVQLGSSGSFVPSGISNGQNVGGHVIGIATPIVTTTYDGFPARLLRFKVGVDLDPTHSYAILVVVPGAPTAGNTDNTVTNSFLINNLSANGLPAPLPMTSDDFSGTIVDYNADPGVDNVISTVVDFLNVKVRVNTAAYNTLSDAALFGSTWNADLNLIRLRIEDEDGTGFGWARTFYKNPFGVFTSGVTLPDSNVINIEDLGGGIMEYSLQVHGCYPNSAGFPDFSGHNVRLRWEFEMNYPFQSWIVRYQYDQRARFEGYKFFQAVIKEINLYDYDSGLPLTSLCQSDFVRVEVKLDTDLMLGYQWNIRAGWTLEPHGFNYNMQIRPAGLNAEQSYPGEFAQLDTPTITFLPAEFDAGGVATFVLDTSGIPLGQRARIHVIAEPTFQCCNEGPLEITSDYAGLDGLTWTNDGYSEDHPTYTDTPAEQFFLMVVDGDWQLYDAYVDEVIFTAPGTFEQACEVDEWTFTGSGDESVIVVCGGGVDPPFDCGTVQDFAGTTLVDLGGGNYNYWFDLYAEGGGPIPTFIFGGFFYSINGGPDVYVAFPGYGETITITGLHSSDVLVVTLVDANRTECPFVGTLNLPA